MKKLAILVTIFFTVGLSLFSQSDSRYDADKNLPFNEKAGDVNPQTGNITLGMPDVQLPGRAGYHFSFSRSWSLNQANVFNMYQDRIDGMNKLSSNTIEKHYRMGVGWSSSIPYIMADADSNNAVLNLFYGGGVYEIDQTGVRIKNPNASNLLGYDLLNMRVYEDSGISYAGFTAYPLADLAAEFGVTDAAADRSKYVLILKTNEKYWFAEDGSLMMQQDKTGLNKIWYFYDNERRLTLVVDTIGRKINFSYNAEGNLSEISWEVTVGQKDAAGVRSQVTETRSLKYNYESAENFSYVTAKKDEILSYRTSYVLVSSEDQMGNVMKYDYREGLAGFTYNKNISHSENVYLMINTITGNYTPDGKFKNQRRFEYEVPAKGMHTKWFYTGYMEQYKISKQYLVDRHGEIMKQTRYIYYDKGEAGNFNQYSTVVELGNLRTTYTYSLSNERGKDHVLDKLLTETNDGTTILKDFVYNADRTKALEEVFHNGKFVYRQKYRYDARGNLKRSEDRGGLVTITEFDDIYSIPIKMIQELEVNGSPVRYEKESVISPLGQVIKQIVFIEENGTKRPIVRAKIDYDQYGNPISQTDANGHTTYTVFDSQFNCFPVQLYQNVDIDSWASGTVHDNWLTEPTGKKKVRIRSWKVYNSDGTLWLEVDNEGYAIEHYYDEKGSEIETVKPDLDDITSFARPLAVNPDGSLVNPDDDFDNFLLNSGFSSFLTSRQNNPSARIHIFYQEDLVKTYTDVDTSAGLVKSTGEQGDGWGNVEKEIEYDSSGNEFAVRMMDYDSLGRMISLTDPDAGSSFREITIHGKRVKRYDKTWLVKYDDLGRKSRVLYPETRQGISDIKQVFYDDVNNTTTTIDPEGNKMVEKKDWNGNTIEVISYGNGMTKAQDVQVFYSEYDKLNRKIKLIDPKGLVTKYVYDERGLLLEQIFEDGTYSASDKMEYNDLGQLVKKTDRKGQVLVYEHDQMGRNTKTIHYKSQADYTAGTIDHTVAMAYDNRGNAVRINNQNLIEHYMYDYTNSVIKLERRIKDASLRNLIFDRVWPGVTADNQVFSFEYSYNQSGMVTHMIYPDGSVHKFSYDSDLARLQKIEEGVDLGSISAFVTDFDYNKADVITRMNYANGTTQTWQFDNRKRIKHSGVTGQAGEIFDLDFTLNGIGNILKINNHEYGYDGFNRIISAKTQHPQTVDRRALVVDHFGAAQVDNPIEIPYLTYADLNTDGIINGKDYLIASQDPLSEVYDVESFEYDKNGNRTKLVQNGDIYTYEYGIRNRLEKIYLTQKGDLVQKVFAEYVYDENGNTIRRTIHTKSGLDTIDFVYDTMNRLVKTTKGTEVTRYLYDNAGNRLAKITGDKTSVYLRHGQVAVAMDMELNHADATTDLGKINRFVLSGELIAGRITTEFTENLTSGEVTTKMDKYWYHLDHLNSTKAVTKADGSLDVLYEYRAFGDELKRIGEGDAKYTYGGKELDGSTNLYYFNARYYDATIGRFINVDPAQDGTNWYIYANNNPLNVSDPTGLWANTNWVHGLDVPLDQTNGWKDGTSNVNSLGDYYKNAPYPNLLVWPAGSDAIGWIYNNKEGQSIKVQIWKGRYPWGIGAEVGIYLWDQNKLGGGRCRYNGIGSDWGLWQPLTKERNAKMGDIVIEMRLKDKNGDVILEYSEHGNFWLTAFKQGKGKYIKQNWADLTLEFRISKANKDGSLSSLDGTPLEGFEDQVLQQGGVMDEKTRWITYGPGKGGDSIIGNLKQRGEKADEN